MTSLSLSVRSSRIIVIVSLVQLDMSIFSAVLPAIPTTARKISMM